MSDPWCWQCEGNHPADQMCAPASDAQEARRREALLRLERIIRAMPPDDRRRSGRPG